MKIGLTYDLKDDYIHSDYSPEAIAELDKPETIEAIAKALQSLGHHVEKIGGLKPLIQALLNNQRWDLVFNIAEGFHGLGRESTIPCLLDEHKIPYTFSDPATLSVCLHKGFTKHVVRQMNVPTADFTVVSTISQLDSVSLPDYPLFVKPVAEGTGKGISEKSLVRSRNELLTTCRDLLDRFRQPVLIETYLPGREFTVGVVGTGRKAKTIGILEVIFNKNAHGKIYSYQNKADYIGKIEYQLFNEKGLSEKINALCLNAWRGLNCRDGGRIDVRLDQHGEPQFIEVNPLAGLHPVDSDLIILCGLAGISYQELISEIMQSATERVL